jgi:hypothetical protein
MTSSVVALAALAAMSGCKKGQPSTDTKGPSTMGSAPSEPEAKATGEGWLGVFPVYPGARQAGWQHIAGIDMHIECTVYAVSDPPEKVAAFYATRFPTSTRESASHIQVRGEAGAVLSVHPVDGNYPRCESKMESSDRTAIVVSKANR